MLVENGLKVVIVEIEKNIIKKKLTKTMLYVLRNQMEKNKTLTKLIRGIHKGSTMFYQKF